MTTLLENPVPVIFVAIVVEAVLAWLLVETGRAVILIAMLGVLILTLAGVVLEWVVVTDKERVQAALYGAADALEDNDLDGVLSYVSETAWRTRSRAELAISQLTVTDIKILSLNITINRLTNPPTAEARFNAVVSYRWKVGYTGSNWHRGWCTVELRLENNRWLITDHVNYSSQSL